ncbi:hypothetical protein ACLMPM_22735 [Yersinia enterocolitica]|uniref:hypothetical protein n=1 Tax=Yersinia enterocolitica TaxID=630 RepID=UPI00398D1FE8
MITPCFDDNPFWKIKNENDGQKKKAGNSENQNGDQMYAGNAVHIALEERVVTTAKDPHLKVPLTFKAAMWMGIGFVAIALTGAWAMYTHLDNKLETYRSGTEGRIETARSGLDGKIDSLGVETRTHFESARVEAKNDNAAINSQLQAISNSLSELNGKLSKDKN